MKLLRLKGPVPWESRAAITRTLRDINEACVLLIAVRRRPHLAVFRYGSRSAPLLPTLVRNLQMPSVRKPGRLMLEKPGCFPDGIVAAVWAAGLSTSLWWHVPPIALDDASVFYSSG